MEAVTLSELASSFETIQKGLNLVIFSVIHQYQLIKLRIMMVEQQQEEKSAATQLWLDPPLFRSLISK